MLGLVVGSTFADVVVWGLVIGVPTALVTLLNWKSKEE